jgi:hypothetical protein
MAAWIAACGTENDVELDPPEAQQAVAALTLPRAIPPARPVRLPTMADRVRVSPLVLTDARTPGQPPAPKDRFPVATTVSVFMVTGYLFSAPPFPQSLRVYAPDGSFYQEIPVSICLASDCPTGATTEHLGLVLNVWNELPVAGTYISQYSIKGRWKVDLMSEGDPKPISTSEFDLY